MDKVKKEAEAVKNAQVESVTDANGLQAVKLTFDSGILFATNKSDLNANSKAALNQCATLLKNNADCDIAIFGHTDNTGSDAINNPLSVKRAKAVETYLKGQGVSATQIRTVDGQGSTNPVADNSTAAGRQQNRRVEIYMYASQAMIQAAEAGTLK
jgi:outer membrane protein OmpA-like peptidoglycan-associated protein